LMRPLFSMENSIVLFQESVEYKHGWNNHRQCISFIFLLHRYFISWLEL
jgi:hypothetical protein